MNALAEKIVKDYGRIDGLVVATMCKPEHYYAPLGKYTAKTFNEVLSGNLTAAFLAMQVCAPCMPEGSAAVLISSTYGVGSPDQRLYQGCKPGGNIYGKEYSLNAPASYTASKAGILGLGKHLATAYAEKGIRVNILTPGGVYDGQEESFHREYVSRTPLGRMAVWSDYSGAILFLLSPASRYMTGSNLIVDGGWTCW